MQADTSDRGLHGRPKSGDTKLRLLPKITPVTVHGPVEFFLAAMALDMQAPQYGEQTLAELFRNRAEKYRKKKDKTR